jgi:Fe2+ transport system protein FeoA
MCSLRLAYASSQRRSLADLSPGDRAVVVAVDHHEALRAERLLALGVTPGAIITILQTFPGIVLLCDQTELAIERAVASSVLVNPVSS